MNVQRTVNGWSCLPASFATVFNLTTADVLRMVGHDGSEVVFPGLPDPYQRRGFHPQEMLDVAEALGLTVVPIQAMPSSLPRGAACPPFVLPEPDIVRFQRYLETGVGVITGLNIRNVPHAVVWDGVDVRDPANGQRYGIHLFQPETFWRVSRQGVPLQLPPEGPR